VGAAHLRDDEPTGNAAAGHRPVLAKTETYHVRVDDWRFSWTPGYDQESAGAIMVGFEMLLFALAIVLAFVFIILREPHDGGEAPL
jgi:hypothetical protein